MTEPSVKSSTTTSAHQNNGWHVLAYVIGALTTLDALLIRYEFADRFYARDCGNGLEVILGAKGISGCADFRGLALARLAVGAGLTYAAWLHGQRVNARQSA